MDSIRTEALSPVFQVRKLTKVYNMGEVPVHALRGVDFELFRQRGVAGGHSYGAGE